MTTPLTPPTFGDKYNVALTDIGQGYAAGITSAGNSVASAIGAVMGGINAKTGEAQEGILGQKKSSEDYLTALHMHGALTDDEYAKAMSSGLGAQQKIAGQFSADFNTRLKAQLDRDNALAQIQAQNQGAMARVGASNTGSLDVARLQQDEATRRAQIEANAKLGPQNQVVRRAPIISTNPDLVPPKINIGQ